jgi:NAD(P)H-dependent flavin oxidoreductase YrpB (nitropropane dioxygenase family)
VDGRPTRLDVGILSSGQVVGPIDDLPSCAELIERIVAEANAVIAELTAGAAR